MKRLIRASEDEEIYSILRGYKYLVIGGPSGDYMGDYDEGLAEYYSQPAPKDLRTNSPKEAIQKWLDIESKYPMDAAIMTNYPEYAQEVCQWVVDNEPEFRRMYDSSNCHYKYDYIYNGAVKYSNKVQCNIKYKDMADQIFPFCYG